MHTHNIYFKSWWGWYNLIYMWVVLLVLLFLCVGGGELREQGGGERSLCKCFANWIFIIQNLPATVLPILCLSFQICPGLRVLFQDLSWSWDPVSRSVLVSRVLFLDLSWSQEPCFKICPGLESPVSRSVLLSRVLFSKSVLVSRVLFQDLSRSLESCFKICPGL